MHTVTIHNLLGCCTTVSGNPELVGNIASKSVQSRERPWHIMTNLIWLQEPAQKCRSQTHLSATRVSYFNGQIVFFFTSGKTGWIQLFVLALRISERTYNNIIAENIRCHSGTSKCLWCVDLMPVVCWTLACRNSPILQWRNTSNNLLRFGQAYHSRCVSYENCFWCSDFLEASFWCLRSGFFLVHIGQYVPSY